jgi:Holliday junction resolvase RusA-like endonuclease
MIFTHGDRRRRDSDNGVNSIFDTLVDVNTLIDDSWQNIPTHTVFNFFNEKYPSCEIRIYSLDEVNLYTEDIKLLTLNCKEGVVNYFSHKK